MTFIPELMGLPVPASVPIAELWMGAHSKAPSWVSITGSEVSLLELILQTPDAILGTKVTDRFGNKLPFLFKILSVAGPLSIQTHPNQSQAIEGFVRENDLGLPLHGPARNYQDDNYKPEIICALGSFWALIGFRPLLEISALLQQSGLSDLSGALGLQTALPEKEGLRQFFSTLMSLNKEQQGRLVKAAVLACRDQGFPVDPIRKWVVRLGRKFPQDAAALAPLFLNLIHLKAGEAAYVAPGELHSYLKGNAVELMANSDNSLRGGLTHKHMDLPELLRVVSFTGCAKAVLHPEPGKQGERIYRTPAAAFQLSIIQVKPGRTYEGRTGQCVSLMICLQGAASIRGPEDQAPILLSRGTVILIPAAVEKYRIEGQAGIYKATVPS